MKLCWWFIRFCEYLDVAKLLQDIIAGDGHTNCFCTSPNEISFAMRVHKTSYYIDVLFHSFGGAETYDFKIGWLSNSTALGLYNAVPSWTYFGSLNPPAPVLHYV